MWLKEKKKKEKDTDAISRCQWLPDTADTVFTGIFLKAQIAGKKICV